MTTSVLAGARNKQVIKININQTKNNFITPKQISMESSKFYIYLNGIFCVHWCVQKFNRKTLRYFAVFLDQNYLSQTTTSGHFWVAS